VSDSEAPDPKAHWPEGALAVAYLARVQRLLDVRGLTGAERELKPLMRRAVAGFRARDLAAVTAACDALVDAIEGPTEAQPGGAEQPAPEKPAAKAPKRKGKS
jgi:hypothetical protein